MKNPRYSDADHNWWRLQHCRTDGETSIDLHYEASTYQDRDTSINVLHLQLWGQILRVYLPGWLKPHAKQHPTWVEYFRRQYGFYLHSGHFVVRLGAQTFDSSTTQSWSAFVPWLNWRYHGQDWLEFRTGAIAIHVSADISYEKQREWESLRPTRAYKVRDYDGTEILAKVTMTRQYWKYGTGWCKWLSLFCPDKVRVSVWADFDKEVGPKKGSWKGGMRGCGIDAKPCEHVDAAFDRLCAREGVVRLP